MAPDTLRADSATANPDLTTSIATLAWDAAFAAYAPIWERWEEEFAQADAMPESPEREAVFKTFYKESLPQYQRARDEFMRVPAPTFSAVAKKMEIADASDEEHHDLCLADIRRLTRELDND